jgi:hypothetical protein
MNQHQRLLAEFPVLYPPAPPPAPDQLSEAEPPPPPPAIIRYSTVTDGLIQFFTD